MPVVLSEVLFRGAVFFKGGLPIPAFSNCQRRIAGRPTIRMFLLFHPEMPV